MEITQVLKNSKTSGGELKPGSVLLRKLTRNVTYMWGRQGQGRRADSITDSMSELKEE